MATLSGGMKEQADNFDCKAGDTVLVRVRERGSSGKLQAKFIADVNGFDGALGPGSLYAVLSPPWQQITTIHLHSYEAEFEVIDRDTLK